MNDIAKLEKFLGEHYPKSLEAYKRRADPFYYEGETLYRPITSGFGCDDKGSNEPLKIVSASLINNGEDYVLSLQSQTNKNNKYSIRLSQACFSIARFDDTVIGTGIPVKASRNTFSFVSNGVTYEIYQSFHRNYENKLTGRMFIHSEAFGSSYGKRHYYDLYIAAGEPTFFLKEVYAYDSVQREQYTIHRNITVRQFKEKVFGNANIKIKSPIDTIILKQE